jgi:hypothetical protein
MGVSQRGLLTMDSKKKPERKPKKQVSATSKKGDRKVSKRRKSAKVVEDEPEDEQPERPDSLVSYEPGYPYLDQDPPFKIELDDIAEDLKFDRLPKRLSVSTITMTCRMGTKIYRKNVAYYSRLHPHSIQSVKFGSNPPYLRCLYPKKKKRKVDNGKPKRRFYNQATIEISSLDHTLIKNIDEIDLREKNDNNSPINAKLFRNGSGQFTGVKSLEAFIRMMKKLFHELRREVGVIKNGTLRRKPFVSDPTKLRVYDITVDLINTNFRVDFKIDRYVLHQLLLKDNTRSTYQPCIHSCVNIKYYYLDDGEDNIEKAKKISIFVFETGAIIITGGNTVDHICKAYDFIIGKINTYGYKIVLIKTEDIFTKSNKLQKYIAKLPDPYTGGYDSD